MTRIPSLLFALALAAPTPGAASITRPLTVAESSDYQATARHAEVTAFVDELAEASPLVNKLELGKSSEGLPIPLLILADPPVLTPEEAEASDKLVVLLVGNIHGGEVCGKEALLQLSRELAHERAGLLDHLIVAVVPLFNPDGNEAISQDNRKNQVGPAEGVGLRANAAGLDLNRDYVKLEASETRGLLKFLRTWDPALTVDTHTTNGSHHRHHLTFAGPKNPAGDPEIVEFVRDQMLPQLSLELERAGGWSTSFYGNFNGDKTAWSTYPDLPRYATNYRGLRNRLSILSEAHAYIPYEQRVRVTHDLCLEALRYAEENRERIQSLIDGADRRAKSGKGGSRRLALRSELTTLEPRFVVPGFVEEVEDGHRTITEEELDYEVELRMHFEPTLEVELPHAYLLSDDNPEVAITLQRHGIEVSELREELVLPAEAWCIDEVNPAPRSFEGHHLLSLSGTWVQQELTASPGRHVVWTGQPLGRLAAYLLEPLAADGLATWGALGDLKPGETYPVSRLSKSVTLTTRSAVPLSEDRERDVPITLDLLLGDDAPRLGGSPVSGVNWIDETSYRQVRGGRVQSVDARSGRATDLEDREAVKAALSSLELLDAEAVAKLAKQTRRNTNEDRTGFVFTQEGDLFHLTTGATTAVRLTDSPDEKEELAKLSPDGTMVAFVRAGELYVSATDGSGERALSKGAGPHVRNGKASWVYFEEILGRNWKAFWWSPDSSRLAYLRSDSSNTPTFTIPSALDDPQRLEVDTYPKPGDANPTVKLGLVRVAGGRTSWVNLDSYGDVGHLITRVAFWPDGKRLYLTVQNRIQTWADHLSVSTRGGTPRKLFREETEAWVKRPPAPHFLDDGSFLTLSEASGWSHVHHRSKSGRKIAELTEGPWEVRSIKRVVEEKGQFFFTGTLDSHTTENLYRSSLHGGEPERLTTEPGWHSVSVSTDGGMFIDSWSTGTEPTRVALRNADGDFLRWLDTNPVHELEDYRHGRLERFQVPLKDGGTLEASLRFPPDYDPAKQYPAWFMTYGGPHAPTVRDRWSRSFAWDNVLTEMGIIVFRSEPRSASGQGARSAWRAYRGLGLSEVEDINEALAWLGNRADVDASRIGMSGHSYGGFMTAFTMTHSKLLAAGIAGAPVTDWRLYDSVYTERYMDTPQDNPEGYDKTSVIKSAGDLRGRLLLLHGTVDDNVHLENTLRLVKALQDEEKQFELMLYPGFRHGIRNPHYRRLVHEFIERELLHATPPQPDDN